MVAVFPFVDATTRAKYISMRLPALCRARRAAGLRTAYQELVDHWRVRGPDGAWLPRRTQKALVAGIAVSLRTFSHAAYATLHYLSVQLLRDLIVHHNDVREFAVAMGAASSLRQLLAATSDLTSLYAFYVDVDALLGLRLATSRLLLTGGQPCSLAALVAATPKRDAGLPEHEGLAPTAHLVPLPANARSVTLHNWKQKLQFAYKCLACDSRLHVHEAVKIFRAIIALRPMDCDVASVHVNLGSVYMLEGELDAAMAEFVAALALDEEQWRAHYNLGLVLLRKGRVLEGKDHLQSAARLRPEHAKSAAIVAEINNALAMAAIEVVAAERERQAFANDVSVVVSFLQRPPTGVTPVRFEAAAAYVADATGIAVPVTVPLSTGWEGAMAAVLHRLYVFAALRRLHVNELLQQHCDHDHPHLIRVAALDELLRTTTGTSFSADERAEMELLFPKQTIIHALLQPNQATADVIAEVRRLGAAYLQLSYPRSRPVRPLSSWAMWLALPLLKWLTSLSSLKAKAPAIYAVLVALDLFTVIHLAKAQPTLKPQHLKPLDLADRGTVIYELFGLRKSVECAAGAVLQGAIRVLAAKAQRQQRRERVLCTKEDRNAHDRTLSRALEGQLRHAAAVRTVAEVVAALVDDAIDGIFALPPLPTLLPCIPLRTELRQRTNLAAAAIQRLQRHPGL
ncbi:hypothetical protein ACHHYP_04856 [Achlya hypogyna]|uniref:Uncharacterized protein n=1 Tax=Achlya hypogyna TaxID=1202772 RepID=A0A1V9YZY5_ACHHY|nr:hypothetical protein ACHHYP_04856 [Achlya hypogyna]